MTESLSSILLSLASSGMIWWRSRHDREEAMEFIVRSPRNHTDVVEVRYDCDCGCKPRARYQRGTDEANHEHCCCGLVHFVGAGADDKLQAYLEERRARGEDADMVYTCYSQAVQAPWGEPVPVAFALPDHPRPH